MHRDGTKLINTNDSAEARKYPPQRGFNPVGFGGTSGKVQRIITRQSGRLKAPHAQLCLD